jgi:transposase
MEPVDFTVKSLDHFGIIAGVMKDLKISSLTDERLPQDLQVGITASEAVKAMILNGLGFSNRVISLTPQFFQTNLWIY